MGRVNISVGKDSIAGWKKPPLKSAPALLSNTNNALVTVNGKGWVVMVESDNNTFSLNIDGVDFIGGAATGYIAKGALLLVRFETSFSVRASNTAETGVLYCLGDDYSTAVFSHYSLRTGAVTTQRLSVTGKGWIHCINQATKESYRLHVNGSAVITDKLLGSSSGQPQATLIPFSTGFVYYTSAEAYNPIIYHLE